MTPPSSVTVMDNALLPELSEAAHDGVSILVATRNDAEIVDLVLDRFIDPLARRLPSEIIVIDLGSSDDTCDLVSNWAETHQVKLVLGSGLGDVASTLAAGALIARYTVLLIVSADEAAPRALIEELTEPVLAGAFEMVFATSANTLHPKLKPCQKALDRLGRLLASPCAPGPDGMSFAFAVRRSNWLMPEDYCRAGSSDQRRNVRVLELPLWPSNREHEGDDATGVMRAKCAAFLRQLSDLGALRRFTAVGLAGFLLDFALVWGSLALGVHPVSSYLSGFICASAFAFLTHKGWTFRAQSAPRFRLARYIVLLAAALGARSGIVTALSGQSLPVEVVIACGILGGGIVSYVGSQRFVFGSRGPIYKSK